jgi:hypothetical protein
MNQQIKTSLGAAVLIIIAITAGAFVWMSQKNQPDEAQNPNLPIEKQGICTQEAKQCSDGSYVSRTGPNCEFAPCPEEKTKQQRMCTQEAKQCSDG